MDSEQNANIEESCSFVDIPKLIHKTDKVNYIRLKQSDTSLHKHGYKVIFADDNVSTHFLSVQKPQTPEQLKNALQQHSSMRILSFHAGVIPNECRLDFHDRISLPQLKRLTLHIQLPSQISPKTPTLPQEFRRLFNFLKNVDYGALENITVLCSVYTALCIPFFSAIVPCYEQEDSHPLIDLLRKNKNTLESLIIGPCMNQCYLRLNPQECNELCEPKGYPQLKIFEGFPKFPILPSWSVLLRPQRHLVRLSVTFTDSDVWKDICMAVNLSSESLQIVELKAFGTAVLVKQNSLNLQVFQNCSNLKKLSIQYFGFNVEGWAFLTPSITELVIGGPFTHTDAKYMASALTNVEDITIYLKPAYIKGEFVQPLNILLHPSFAIVSATEFLKGLKEISIEWKDMTLDWEVLKNWVAAQSIFKLKEVSSEEFTLLKSIPEAEPEVQTVVTTEEENISPKTISPKDEEIAQEEEEQHAPGFFTPCLAILGLRN